MSMLNQVKFWSDDLGVLVNTEYLFEFFPTKSHTMNQKLNAITRLAIYVVALLTIQSQSFEYIKYLIYVMIATYAIYYYKTQNVNGDNVSVFAPRNLVKAEEKSVTINKINQQDTVSNPSNLISQEKIIETIDNVDENCVKPSLDNPFMNVNYVDYLDNPNRNQACDITSPEVKKDANSKFMNNLFRDTSDLFETNNSQRQFYTMPSTTIPNKQDEFAKWLYLSPKTCKEDQDYCLRYEDLRQNRPVMMNPYENPTNTKRLEKQE